MSKTLKIAFMFLLLCIGVVLCDGKADADAVADTGDVAERREMDEKVAADDANAEEEDMEGYATDGDVDGSDEEEEDEEEEADAQTVMHAIDANGDGKISLEEAVKDFRDEADTVTTLTMIQDFFKKSDVDNDGFLTMEEFPSFTEKLKEDDGEGREADEDADKEGKAETKDEEDIQSLMDEDIQSLMDEADTDKDGKVTLEEVVREFGEDPEMVAMIEEKFKKTDADKDGFLSTEEIQAFAGTFTDEDWDGDDM